MNRSMLHLRAIALVLGCTAAVLGTACDDKKTTEAKPTGDAGVGTDKYATADPKLEKALQAAAAAGSSANENGPPPDGIFAPGVADRRHPKGAPSTVDTLNDGSEPRVSLSATPPDAARSSSYGLGALELGMQMGSRGAAPSVDLQVVLRAGKDGEGGADALVADVKKATPAREQPGELPPGTDKVIGSLSGTSLRLKLGADGKESSIDLSLGSKTAPEIERLAQNAAEALVATTVPLPDRPVGVGAQWIAESRMPFSGLDVISYRAFKVKSIDGNRVRLSVDVKAYAASTDTKLQGLPKEATLDQVDAIGQGELELVRGEILARKADIKQVVLLVFKMPPGAAGAPPTAGPGQPPGTPLTGQMQMQTTATFVRGDDLRAALKP
jgi:hypothetical protein